VFGRHELALERLAVCMPLVEKLRDIALVEYLVVLLVEVESHVFRRGVSRGAFLVEVGLPVLEIVLSSAQVEVFLSGRNGAVVVILRGLHQSAGVPRRQTGHPVQRPQLQLGIQVADVYLTLPRLLHGVGAGRLRNGV
jgi:hypothetical protein